MILSTRRKLMSVFFATAIFVALAFLIGTIMQNPLDQLLVGATTLGLLSSIFEEFYVQSRQGRWLRQLHTVLEIMVHSLFLLVLFFLVMYFNHAIFGRMDQIPNFFERLHISVPVFVVLSVLLVTILRVVGFVGGKNLLHLIIGKYHRPQIEKRLFLFLDMKGSTQLVERLGALRARELIGKFFFDISQPITDQGGEIYRFTGDGLVAVWDFTYAVGEDRIVNAIDAIVAAVKDETEYYCREFDHFPSFRIGVHGGDIVVSEEGDNKRSIGFYGDNIHIAARLEQKAKELDLDCLLSEKVTEQLKLYQSRLRAVGELPLRGVTEPLKVYQLML